VLIAPCPIRLKQGTIREPDVLFLKPERVRLKEPPNGADLVFEIISEGREARERDLQIKRAEYALAGISEYWIVDPEQQSITVLTLNGQQYRENGVFACEDNASSVLLPGFAISVTELFSVGDQLA
jgi:Uma2 family endonuclease